MIENVDYKLMEFNEAKDSIDDQWTVEILTDQFNGVKIQYGTITIDEDSDELKFNYSLIDTNQLEITENNPDLIEVVKEILHSVLTNALSHLEHLENQKNDA